MMARNEGTCLHIERVMSQVVKRREIGSTSYNDLLRTQLHCRLLCCWSSPHRHGTVLTSFPHNFLSFACGLLQATTVTDGQEQHRKLWLCFSGGQVRADPMLAPHYSYHYSFYSRQTPSFLSRLYDQLVNMLIH